MGQPPIEPFGSELPTPPGSTSDLPPAPQGVSPPPLSRPQSTLQLPPSRPSKRVPVLAVIVVIVLLAAVVGAIFVFTRGDEPTGDADGTATGAQQLEPPGSFAADPRPFSVELSWKGSEGEVEGYNIYRDGELVEQVSSTQTRFVDDTILPLQQITYQIEAVGADTTSARRSVRVRTPAAPLGQARVDGLYHVIARDTRHFGFSSFSGDFTTGWRFRPICESGPCDVAWNDVNVKEFASVLAQQGAMYAGSDPARFGKCGSRLTNATWTIRFHVAAAATRNEAWRATKIEGTIVQRSAAQLGCVASGADYDIAGTLAG